MEALNVSTLWDLPLILVCEHNTWSEFSPSDTVTAGEIVDRAKAFKIPSSVVDGNNALEVWEATAAAVERARAGEGPSFIEAKTYRTYGHNESEVHWLSSTYRTDEEIEMWRARDPIQHLARHLLDGDHCLQSDLDNIENEISERVKEAAQFAESGGEPDPAIVNELMFHNQAP